MIGHFLVLALYIQQTAALGWHDVCMFEQATTTCYVWPANPPPYNMPQSFLESALCERGCRLYLHTRNMSCENIIACQTASVDGSPYTYNLSTPLSVTGPRTTIKSLLDSETIKFQISASGSDGQLCRAFEIRATDISLSNMNFTFDSTCPDNKTMTQVNHVPIIIRAGGTINLTNIYSAKTVAVVLHTNILTIDLRVKNIIIRQGSFPIMAFNINYTSNFTCTTATNILVVPHTNPALSTCNLMDTSPYAQTFADDPSLELFTCPAVTTTEATNCEKKADLHLILIMVLVALSIGLAFAGTCILCQKCKKSSHNFLGEGAVKNLDCPT